MNRSARKANGRPAFALGFAFDSFTLGLNDRSKERRT
jgi:hypothetical protein